MLSPLSFDFAPALDKAWSVSSAGAVTLTSARGPGVPFSRASGAMFTDSDGIVKWGPENLVIRSTDISHSAFTKQNAVATASGASVPVAGLSACRYAPQTANAFNRIILGGGQSLPTWAQGVPYTQTWVVKADGYSKIAIRESRQTGAFYAFDLTAGSLLQNSGGSTYRAENLGDGWWRFDCTFITGSAAKIGPSLYVLPPSFTTGNPESAWIADGVSGVLVAYVGSKRGLAMDGLIPAAASAVFGPCFEHDPVTGACLGVRAEGQRANLFAYSAPAPNGSGSEGWWPVSAASTKNAGFSPSGFGDAVLLSGTADTVTHAYAADLAIASGTSYVFSVFAKAGTKRFVQLAGGGTTFGSVYATFDLLSGDVNAVGCVAGVKLFPNGWYRCWVVMTAIATATTTPAAIAHADSLTAGRLPNSVMGGLYVWGGQFEAGLFPTSLIPTAGAAVTRSADVLGTISGADFADIWNAGESTLVCDGVMETAVGVSSPQFARLSDGGAGDVVQLALTNAVGEGMRHYVIDSSVTQAVFQSGNLAPGARGRSALVVRGNGFRAMLNASAALSDGSGTVPTLDRMQIGYMPGRMLISRIRMFRKALPDVRLVDLTKVLVNSVAPAVTGDVYPGGVLAVSTGTWNVTPEFSYQWYRNGEAVAGATSPVWTVPGVAVDGDGLFCRVIATALDMSLRVDSAPVTVDIPVLPVNTSPASVAGTPDLGGTLTATPGAWDDADTVTGEWFVNGSATGDTDTSFVIDGSVPNGAQILYRETAVSEDGSVQQASNTVTLVITAPANSVAPVASGTPEIGETLSVTSGTWQRATSLAYQWRVNGSPVSGATGTTWLVPGTVAHGDEVTCRVTASNVAGSASADSNVLDIVVGAAPGNISPPEIESAHALVLPLDTLSINDGSWDDAESLAYQWRLDGVDVPGATGSDFVVPDGTAEDVAVTCVVTAANGFGSTAEETDVKLVDAVVPRLSRFPILGVETRPKVWISNDEISDAFLYETAVAAHIGGHIELVGMSQSISTDDGYNTSGAFNESYPGYLAQQGTELQAMLGKMTASNWDITGVPAPGALSTGYYAKTGYTHAQAAALVAAAAGCTKHRPLIVVAGGQLTILAEAYALDDTLPERVVVSFIAGPIFQDAGWTAVGGHYNSWADAEAAALVHAEFDMVCCPIHTTSGVVDSFPSVTTSWITSNLPDSEIRTALLAKDNPHNHLPYGSYDIDGDASALLVLIDQDIFPTVQRRTATGEVSRSQGTSPAVNRNVPVCTDDAAGNTWWPTSLNQSLMTTIWRSIWTSNLVWRRDPVNTVAPAVTGALESGAVVGVTSGTWLYADSFNYQWYFNDVPVGTNSSSYLLPAVEPGDEVYCVVQGVNAYGDDTAAAPTRTVAGEEDESPSDAEIYSATVAGLAPRAWWKLSEASGTVIADSSGNGLNGTLSQHNPGVNFLYGETGVVGSAPENKAMYANGFSGLKARISFGNPAGLQITGQITLAAWIAPGFLFGANTHAVILSKGVVSGVEAYFLRLRKDGSSNLFLEAGSYASGADYFASYQIPSWPAGEWRHVVGLYDGTHWRVYMNGAEVANFAAGVGARSTTANVMAFGEMVSDTFSRGIDGRFDEMMIFPTGLSAAQVAALYDATLAENLRFTGQSHERFDVAYHPAAFGTGPYVSQLQVSASETGPFVSAGDPVEGSDVELQADGLAAETSYWLRVKTTDSLGTERRSRAYQRATWSARQGLHVDAGFGMFVHFNMGTFSGEEWAAPSNSPNTFNPGATLDIDQWLDAAEAAGMTYACLTAKHHDGFCLWPSASQPHNITASSWYAANGSRNILQEFCTKVRARGMRLGIYFSVDDRKWRANNSGWTNTAIENFCKAQLTEILGGTYGTIDFVWLDGWGWQSAVSGDTVGLHFSTIPYANLRDHVHGLQSGCTVVVNDHGGSLSTTEVVVFEGGTINDPIPAANTFPAEVVETIHGDGGWFHPDSGSAMSAANILIERDVTNARFASYMLNVPPGTDGLIPSSLVTILETVGGA